MAEENSILFKTIDLILSSPKPPAVSQVHLHNYVWWIDLLIDRVINGYSAPRCCFKGWENWLRLIIREVFWLKDTFLFSINQGCGSESTWIIRAPRYFIIRGRDPSFHNSDPQFKKCRIRIRNWTSRFNIPINQNKLKVNFIRSVIYTFQYF